MIPLETNRRLLTWLCIYPTVRNCGQWKKCLYIVFSVSIFGFNLFAVATSGVYFMRHKSISLEDVLFALIQTIGSANVAFINIITFCLRHKIVGLFEMLAIYKDRESLREIHIDFSSSTTINKQFRFCHLKVSFSTIHSIILNEM